jgi:RNA polymerase sigma-70 factor (ECF subfamily)
VNFPQTEWILLAKATLNGDDDGYEAVAKMCEIYRQPVAIFIAARGYLDQEREDLVQEFFLSWLRSQSWKRAQQSRGRFRNFLLGSVCHMLAHHQARQNTLKRGSGDAPESLEAALERGFEPTDETPLDSPDFDREWAVTLVMNALQTLSQEYATRGSAADFDILQRFLPAGGETMTLEAAAERLDTNVGAVKSAVHRLRMKFRETLRSAVACTVCAPHEVDEELRYLHALLLRTRGNIIACGEGGGCH